MASFQQICYCKNCKKNVGIDNKGKCKKCGSTSLNKTWSVRFRHLENEKEKQKRLSGFITKNEAKQAYINFITCNKQLKTESTNKLLISVVFAEYLQTCKLDNEESTIYDKQNIFNKFILPTFNSKDVRNISKIDLINWQTFIACSVNNKTNKHYTYKYLSKIRTVFNKFLVFCEEMYNITNNFKYIKPLKNKDTKKDIKFWEIETFNAFIKTVDNILWQTIWLTFFYTGARFNEIRALSDNNIDGDSIIISKSMISKKCKYSEVKIKSTKNNKIVRKKIPDILSAQIKKYKNWKNLNNIDSTFLFGGKSPLSENMIRRKLIEDIKKANVERITPHGFRHSYVSMLIHFGVSTKVIAELIGDTEEQIIKTYGHLYSNAKDAAIDIVNKNLNKKLQLSVISNNAEVSNF